jgi:hypothetical protein
MTTIRRDATFIDFFKNDKVGWSRELLSRHPPPPSTPIPIPKPRRRRFALEPENPNVNPFDGDSGSEVEGRVCEWCDDVCSGKRNATLTLCDHCRKFKTKSAALQRHSGYKNAARDKRRWEKRGNTVLAAARWRARVEEEERAAAQRRQERREEAAAARAALEAIPVGQRTPEQRKLLRRMKHNDARTRRRAELRAQSADE